MTVSGPRADTATHAGPHPGVSEVVLWYGVASGPVAWTLRLLISYPLAPLACDIGSDWPLHLTTIVMALAAVAGGLLAWRAWRRLPAGDGRRTGRAHFMAVSGVLMNAVFLLAILNEGSAPLFQDSCIIPTQDPPRAGLPSGVASVALGGLSALGLAPVRAWAAHGVGPGKAAHAGAWTLDLVVVVPLLLLSLAYAAGTRAIWHRAGPHRVALRRRAWAGVAAVAVLVVALLSPLDALSAELFTAHMVQHLLLMLVAAPLVVLAAPWTPVLRTLPWPVRRTVARARRHPIGATLWLGIRRPPVAFLLHAVALWIWHAPLLYEAALTDRALHVLEHVCFLGTAVLFWALVLHAGRPGSPDHGIALVVVFATMIQSAALGAILTFASEPWYTVHAGGAARWGLSALEDQQLAGVVMWAPAGLVYVLTGALLFLGWLRAAERRVATREAYGSLRPPPVPGRRG